MQSESKERFLYAVLRIKKADICFGHPAGMQTSELAVMIRASSGCVRDQSGCTVSEIQQSMPITKPAVSQILNNLERKEYIVRTIDSGDRRKIKVTLTEYGRAELKESLRRRDEALERIIAGCGEENIRQFTSLAERLLDTMEAVLAQEPERKKTL